VRDSLRKWLPVQIADERAINATTPMIMAEGISAAAMSELIPADCIEAALQNESAMCGYVASRDQILDAIRAWELADARRSSVIVRRDVMRRRQGK
jgi:hypothetical protein